MTLPLLAGLRWVVPALVPAALLALVVHKTDKNREPAWLVTMTFVLGGVSAAVSLYIERQAALLTRLDVQASVAGEAGALLFLFALVAPVREAMKVVAVWPAFRSRHFDEPYDGIVYASAAALGFAAVENAVMLRAHPSGSIWPARALVALPAHLFFACLWGYALGRAKRSKVPGGGFPLAWVVAVIGHGLYAHFVHGRGPGALVAVLPLLLAMGGVTWFAGRDLRARGERPSRIPEGPQSDGNRLSRTPFARLSAPPSLRAVREALRRADQPIALRWIGFGAVVTIGTMVAGVGLAIAFAFWAHVDFSTVDEHDAATAAPLALLAAGLLGSFPVAGFLIARASNLPTLLETAAATGLAIVATLVLLAFAAPIAVVFGLAFSPVAFGLACAGAWVGRPLR